MDDAQLVAATLRGNNNAFAELVRGYQRVVLASACQIVRNPEDAEDLAQETFLEAYRDLARLREQGSFRSWLFSILRRNCYEYLRRRRPEELPLEEVIETQAAPAPFSGELPLAECLEQLPLPQREILLARYMYGMSYREIARSLQITELVARVRCLRARGQLRVLIEKNDAEERALRKAMSGLAIGVSTSFTNRVLHALNSSPVAPVAASAPAALPAAQWLGQTLAQITAWKVAALVGMLAVLGGGAVLLGRHHRRATTPHSPRVMTAIATPVLHPAAAEKRKQRLAPLPVQRPLPLKAPLVRMPMPAALHTPTIAPEITTLRASLPTASDNSGQTAPPAAPAIPRIVPATSAPIAEIWNEHALRMDWFSEPLSGGKEMFSPVYIPFAYRAQGVPDDPNQRLTFPTLLNFKFGFAPDDYSYYSPAYIFRNDQRALTLGVTEAKMIADYIKRWSATVAIGGSLTATPDGYTGELLVFAKSGAVLLRKRYATPLPYFTLMGRMVEDWLAYRRQPCSPALHVELERPMTAKMETVQWYGESFQQPWRSKAEWAVYERILADDPDFGEVRYRYASQRALSNGDSAETCPEMARAFCSHEIPEAINAYSPYNIPDTALRAQADAALARALALQPDNYKLLCAGHFAYGNNDKSSAEMDSLLPYVRKYPNAWLLLHHLANYYCTHLQFDKGLPLALHAANTDFPHGGKWDEYILAAAIYWHSGHGANARYCLQQARREASDSEQKLTTETAIVALQRDFLDLAGATSTAGQAYTHFDQFSKVQNNDRKDEFLTCCQLAAEDSGQADMEQQLAKEVAVLPEQYAALCTQRAAISHGELAADRRVALPLDDADTARWRMPSDNPGATQSPIIDTTREMAMLQAGAAMLAGRAEAASDARHAWCYSPLVPRSAFLLEEALLKQEPQSLLRYAEVAQWLAPEEPYWRGLKRRALAAGAREDGAGKIATLIAAWNSKVKASPLSPRQSAAFWADAPPFLPEYLLMKTLAQHNHARISAAANLFAEYFQGTALYPGAYQVHLHVFYDKVSRLLPADIAAQFAGQLGKR